MSRLDSEKFAIDFGELSQVIRFHRKKSGLNQVELARLSGVGKTAVFDLEKGKSTVQLDTLRKVLRVLNIRMILHSPLMDVYLRSKNENR